MRVLHVFYEIKYSGAEIMYANAAPLFQENKIEMLALNTAVNLGDFVARFEAAGIKVHHKSLPNGTLSPFTIISYCCWLFKFIKDNNIRVIHIHRNPFYWWFALIGFLTNIRTIRTIHNVFINKNISWLKAVLQRSIARNIFKTTFQTIGQSVYQNELEFFKNPSVKINNWYDDSRFYPPVSVVEKLTIRKELNIPVDSFVIISTGACTYVKNHHDIIKSLPLINKEVNCLYLHLGNGPTVEEEKCLCTSLNVNSSVRFLDNKDNVRDYLIASDVYLMPSRFEGLSIAAIEAMACGIPSVLNNVPGLRDLIEDDNNGFLIKEDYIEIAKKVVVYKKLPLLAKAKSENAISFVNENFSMQNGVEKIIYLYKSK